MGRLGALEEMGTQGWGDGDNNYVMGTGIMGDGDQGRLATEMRKMGLGMECCRQGLGGDRELGM